MDDFLIYIKIHTTPNGNIIAMCDEELIDKVLKEGDIVINIKDYSDFYTGELIKKENKLSERYKTDIYSANIIGKDSVLLAIKNKIINEQHVKKVHGVPYAQAYRID